MRKLIKVVLVTILVFLLWPTPASAEETPPKGGEDTPGLVCRLVRFVDPSLADENGAFPVNTLIDYLVDVTDPGNQVDRIVVSASSSTGLGAAISDGTETSFTFTQPTPGTWTITAKLYEGDIQLSPETDSCMVHITFAEASEPVPEKVDCTIQVHANKDQLNGGYVTGEPISFELYVPRFGPMQWFFIASRDGGAEYELNDGMDNKLTWTPTVAGTYTLRGKFIASKTGEELEVLEPGRCKTTFVVSQASTPHTTTPTTVPPTFIPATPEATVTDQLVVATQHPAVLASDSAHAAELPRTGLPSTFTLVMIGFGFIIIGTVLVRKSASKLV